jgi:hypothetical protein
MEAWSEAQFRAAAAQGPILINPIVHHQGIVAATQPLAATLTRIEAHA